MQLTTDDLKGMAPEEISDAYEAGQFAELLGADPAEVDAIERAGDVLTVADVKAFAAVGRHDLIDRAYNEGRINTDSKENDR